MTDVGHNSNAQLPDNSNGVRNSWTKLGEITARITDRLAPVVFTVPIQGSLAVALMAEAMKTGNKPETVIAEAVRAYMGDAA